MMREASTRSRCGSGRCAISRKRWRTMAGCIRTRADCIPSPSSRTRSEAAHPASEIIADGYLTLLVPVEHHDHHFSRGSNLSAIVFADLVVEIEGAGPHLTNANTDVNRLHPDLVTEVTLCARDDEMKIAHAFGAGDLLPQIGSRDLEVGEVDGVVDVAE